MLLTQYSTDKFRLHNKNLTITDILTWVFILLILHTMKSQQYSRYQNSEFKSAANSYMVKLV